MGIESVSCPRQVEFAKLEMPADTLLRARTTDLTPTRRGRLARFTLPSCEERVALHCVKCRCKGDNTAVRCVSRRYEVFRCPNAFRLSLNGFLPFVCVFHTERLWLCTTVGRLHTRLLVGKRAGRKTSASCCQWLEDRQPVATSPTSRVRRMADFHTRSQETPKQTPHLLVLILRPRTCRPPILGAVML